MLSTEYQSVVILGAGPAGLSIGYELKRRNIDYIILEKGTMAGESFSHYPKHIFFGPWLNNTLPGSTIGWTWKLRRSTQPAYTWYLGQYARHNDLRICFNTSVEKVVTREGGGFTIQTTQGKVDCALLVNATGYYSTPNLPYVPGLDQASLPWMHSHDYREAADLRRLLGDRQGFGRVLVVGAGLTAGETMTELHREGFQVSLSHRGTLKFGPSPLKEALLSPLMSVVEKVALTLDIRLNSNPPMAGGEPERLVKEGLVKVFPSIAAAEGSTLIFADGRRETFDSVVFCTGYRYTRRHLDALLNPEEPIQIYKMESTRVPGLFFMGLDQQRTYRSRFLRGIRADAKLLGQLIGERLSQTKPNLFTAPIDMPLPIYETFIDLEKVPYEVRS